MAGSAGRFGRSDRLLHARDFRRVMREGARAASDEFVVLLSPRPPSRHRVSRHRDGERAPTARLGITVSRKIGNAVKRNRIKRRVREWFRYDRGSFEGVDVVVIARPPAVGVTYVQSTQTLTRLREQSQARVST